jgi:hypothetical protein
MAARLCPNVRRLHNATRSEPHRAAIAPGKQRPLRRRRRGFANGLLGRSDPLDDVIPAGRPPRAINVESAELGI